jgi:hypothetical protein
VPQRLVANRARIFKLAGISWVHAVVMKKLTHTSDSNATLPVLDSLGASAPDPGLTEQLKLFGQFVGSWTVELTNHHPDGSHETVPAAWHFGWVLQGRAVQDVFLAPSTAGYDGAYREYGTTIRFYDPSIDAWRVVWSGPVRGRQILLIGQARGEEIMLKGREQSVELRWVFSQVRPESFRWRAAESADGGYSWTVVQEMVAQRVTTTTVERPAS